MTLNQVRRMIRDRVLPSFTSEELWETWLWLDNVGREVEEMKQIVLEARGNDDRVD